MLLHRTLAVLSLALLGFTSNLNGQITEVPTTVKPGSFLLEMDALSLTVDRNSDGKYTSFGAAFAFLTTGLTHNWDIQIGAQLFISQDFDMGGLSDRSSGIGDVYVRTKYLFYEDQESGTALSLLPYVKIPTNSGGVGNDSVEGGIIVPWTTTLPGAFRLSAMAKVDFLRNDDETGFDSYWYASLAITRSITNLVGVYGEFAAGKSSGSSAVNGIMGGGVILSLSENISWDFAMYRGISDHAADWQHVLRFNWGF